MSTEQDSHAHDSVQPTLIMLDNFERRTTTKTVLLMLRLHSNRQTATRKERDSLDKTTKNSSSSSSSVRFFAPGKAERNSIEFDLIC